MNLSANLVGTSLSRFNPFPIAVCPPAPNVAAPRSCAAWVALPSTSREAAGMSPTARSRVKRRAAVAKALARAARAKAQRKVPRKMEPGAKLKRRVKVPLTVIVEARAIAARRVNRPLRPKAAQLPLPATNDSPANNDAFSHATRHAAGGVFCQANNGELPTSYATYPQNYPLFLSLSPSYPQLSPNLSTL